MIRQLVGMLLATTTLVLNIERADVACAKHTVAPVSGGHSGHTGHLSHEQRSSDKKDCETPAQEDCCQAVTTCSIALGLDEATADVVGNAHHVAIVSIVLCAPNSRVAAPEPPPPRA